MLGLARRGGGRADLTDCVYGLRLVVIRLSVLDLVELGPLGQLWVHAISFQLALGIISFHLAPGIVSFHVISYHVVQAACMSFFFFSLIGLGLWFPCSGYSCALGAVRAA